MVARLAPEPWQQDVDIPSLRQAVAAMANDAYWRAIHMEQDRPYSSGPPSRHPVWSDALREESALLREGGLMPPGVRHPWEQDPVGWPSADPVVQAALVADTAERAAWHALATEIGEEPDDEMRQGWNTQGGFVAAPETGWGIREDRILTAVDLIRDYGHQPLVHHARSTTMAETPETTPDTPTHDPRPATAESIIRDALRAWFQDRAATREREGTEDQGMER